MTAIGPYEFSAHDVMSTLAAGRKLFDLLTNDLPAEAVTAVAPFRVRAEAALDDVATHDREAALGLWWGEWRSAMAAVRRTGAFGKADIGTAAGLFLGGGGVPKQRVESLDVAHDGVVGDRQANRIHHGRPWQALCLWSTEAVDHFRAEGHSVAPGLAGENVSVTGLAWERVRPGAQLRIGDVLAEVSSYAIPCQKNARWFLDGRFDAMHDRHGPRSRVYATVIEPGAVMAGAPVLLEPDA